MTDPISMVDARRLKRLVDGFVELLIEHGFDAVHVGTVMAAVGAAMVKASGDPGDVDKVVDGLRQAVTDDRNSNLK